jgi:hypothetical protein
MSGSKVVQFSEVRREKQESLRREYERVLFNRILGCYTVIEKLGLKSVEMRDISKSGCSFRMPSSDGAFRMDESLDFRFYFSNTTYVPARLTIKRVSKEEDNGMSYWLYGCSFDTELSTYSAIERFVEFINAYSVSAKEDKGDKQIWYF